MRFLPRAIRCSISTSYLSLPTSEVCELTNKHSTFLDRVWWRWQEQALPERLTDIAGYTANSRAVLGMWVNATLNDEMNMYGIVSNATIRELMDIGSERLCYEYVDPE